MAPSTAPPTTLNPTFSPVSKGTTAKPPPASAGHVVHVAVLALALVATATGLVVVV
jgi:hypothetical protein